MPERKILVTAALPYANGPIHVGHLVEYIQTDIWVRFQKLRGHRCIFLCADDTHGTAIMMSAKKAGISEQAWIDRMREEHVRDFSAVGVEFDNYGSTHSDENRDLCARFWKSLRDADLIQSKQVDQLFDPEAGIFLADRFVRGTCPNCKTPDQYGDSCDRCGATYSAAELIDPVSVYSGATPVMRSAEHALVRIEKLHDFLDDWTQTGNRLQPEIANYLKNQFLDKELKDWDVSRPAPYWGFEIPDMPGNYWFVWFDAPIGYVASTHQWCKRHGESLDDWWLSPEVEIHHFIGKDIAYFHTLFWPSMLKTAGFTLPAKVHVHGFLTVNGRKMSKRDGTFVKAATYSKHFPAACLRYYFASRLGPGLDNLDLSIDEFLAKTNGDLVGKVVNLASRTAKFAEATGLSAEYPEDGGLFANGALQGASIAEAYENCDYARATRLIMELADRANEYVESAAPWTLKKDPAQAQRLQDVCTVALNLFRQIATYLGPVLPELKAQTDRLLTVPATTWEDVYRPLAGTPVARFEHMMKRIEPKDFEAMIEESKEESAAVEKAAENAGAKVAFSAAPPADAAASSSSGAASASEATDDDGPLKAEPLAETCTIEDFGKVDLRIARVVAAEPVAEADKLLRLTLSLGGSERRNVFAGIKKAYDAEALVGRLVVMVANLAPRKMRFGISEGMVVASGPGGEEVFLLSPDDGAKPGQRVH
ncbi:MAG TPA: methionine--tRNA ligase [Pirellulaceae bacterium]|jgi:methionyl-tRNA synthetase|nr:methionine--tRNA ligase [Pirellulaceae bacterium]